MKVPHLVRYLRNNKKFSKGRMVCVIVWCKYFYGFSDFQEEKNFKRFLTPYGQLHSEARGRMRRAIPQANSLILRWGLSWFRDVEKRGGWKELDMNQLARMATPRASESWHRVFSCYGVIKIQRAACFHSLATYVAHSSYIDSSIRWLVDSLRSVGRSVTIRSQVGCKYTHALRAK